MPDDLTPEQKAQREMILWEELRSVREIALKMLEWGVTVLAALQATIFFFRTDLYQRMMAGGELHAGQYLPWNRYIMGTVYLLFMAVIFSYLLGMVGNRYRKIRAQLVEVGCFGIEHGDSKKVGRYLAFMVFFAFPILDIALRVLISINIHFELR